MSQKSVFCIAASRIQANRIVGHLINAGFSNDDISILFPDGDSTGAVQGKRNTKARAAAFGAGTGGVLGGAFGWLAGIGALVIPGMGPFIAGGPIAAVIGAALGGVTGALAGMGIPEFVARHYEGRLKDGHLLISVHTDKTAEIIAAKKIFRAIGAEDIAVAGEDVCGSGETHLNPGMNLQTT